MKKFIVAILIVVFLVSTPIYAQTPQNIYSQLVTLLVQVNQLLRLQADIMKLQIADLQAQNIFLENRLQTCSIPTPKPKVQKKAEVNSPPPPTRTNLQTCPAGRCYQISDEYHY